MSSQQPPAASDPNRAGPSDDARVTRTPASERTVAGVRLAVIASSVLIFPLLAGSPNVIPTLAYALIGVATVFGVAVYLAAPHHRGPSPLASYLTSLVDAALAMIWLYATGGIDSPFYVLLYMAVAAVGFRFSRTEALVSAALYAGAYVALLAGLGQIPGNVPEVVVRVTYIFLSSLLGSLVSRDVLEQTLAKARVGDKIRAQAEAAERRANFLADASAILTSTLQSEATLENLAGLLVPVMGDTCVIDVIDTDGSMRRVAEERRGARKNLASSAVVPVCSVTIPLRSGERVLGSITLTRFQPGGAYDPAELSLAEELAQRAGLALENAQLFRSAQEARARAQIGQAEAQRQSERLHALLMEVPAIVTITRGPTHVYEFINPLAQRALGKRAVVGKSILETMPELEAQGLTSVAEKVMTTGQPEYAQEYPLVLDWEDSGRIHKRFFNFVYQPLRKPNGTIDGLMTFAFDVTDQVVARWRSQAAERRAELLNEAGRTLASSLDYLTTLPGVCSLAVPALGDWCCVDLLDTEGALRRVASAYPDPAMAGMADELHRACPLGGRSGEGVTAVLRRANLEMHSSLTGEMIQRGVADPAAVNRLGALGVKSAIMAPLVVRGQILGTLTLLSVKSQRQFEDNDLTLANELGRRAALAVDNARLYEDAQLAIQARDEFLSIASHELKTPLTSLDLQVQSLQRNALKAGIGGGADGMAGKLGMIDRQVDRLAGLIENLLDVSRVMGGRLVLDLEDTDWSEVIRDVAARLKDHLADAACPLSLRLEPECVGHWDRLRLEQIATNLLSNAIKYGPGAAIEVALSANADRAILTVTDRGIGIPAEDQARIFKRFERAVSHRHADGLGLGLWIVHQIVTAMGGTVGVQSGTGQGSTFTVILPRLPQDRALPANDTGRVSFSGQVH
jgi:signal transduction histidine kinase/PAS domain-containing protein